MIQKSQEDYLRIIYSLGEKNANVKIKSVDVADALHVSKPAMSKMLKKLQQEKFVLVKDGSGIVLTKKGLLLAEKITHKHRVIEVFLQDILKVAKKEICSEAHELEHAFSDKMIMKLDDFLHNPKNCPHGNSIPVLK